MIEVMFGESEDGAMKGAPIDYRVVEPAPYERYEEYL